MTKEDRLADAVRRNMVLQGVNLKELNESTMINNAPQSLNTDMILHMNNVAQAIQSERGIENQSEEWYWHTLQNSSRIRDILSSLNQDAFFSHHDTAGGGHYSVKEAKGRLKVSELAIYHQLAKRNNVAMSSAQVIDLT